MTKKLLSITEHAKKTAEEYYFNEERGQKHSPSGAAGESARYYLMEKYRKDFDTYCRAFDQTIVSLRLAKGN